MTSEEIVCVSCYKHISNPVCWNCYLRQFRSWLNSTNLESYKKNVILSKLKSRIVRESLHDTSCIICENEQVNLCFACFSTEAHLLLKSSKTDKYTIDAFMGVFNYAPYLNN